MATFSPPILHADTESTWGLSYDYLGSAVLEQLVERQDVTNSPFAVYLGDLAGSGTDTLRIRNGTGWGYAASFTAMSTETQAITASSITGDYDAFTVARNGLAFEASYQRDGLNSDGINIEALAMSIVDSWRRLLLTKVCTTGAAFATNVADAAATLDVDDAIALRAAYEETSGFDLAVHGAPWAMLNPVQVKHLRASIRTESALLMPDAFAQMQGIQNQAGFRMRFLDMDFYASDQVSLSGGDYYGFSGVRGSIGYVVMSTANIPVPSGADPQRVPQYGLLITRKTDGAQATNRVDANAWLGVAASSTTVAPQFLVRSNAT